MMNSWNFFSNSNQKIFKDLHLFETSSLNYSRKKKKNNFWYKRRRFCPKTARCKGRILLITITELLNSYLLKSGTTIKKIPAHYSLLQKKTHKQLITKTFATTRRIQKWLLRSPSTMRFTYLPHHHQLFTNRTEDSRQACKLFKKRSRHCWIIQLLYCKVISYDVSTYVKKAFQSTINM